MPLCSKLDKLNAGNEEASYFPNLLNVVRKEGEINDHVDKERSASSPISSEGNTFVKKEENILGKNISNLTGTINVDYENLTIQKNISIDVTPRT